MIPYNQLIDELLIGETPKEKHENLEAMIKFLCRIAYPKRGTADEKMTIDEIAKEIQDRFSLEDLDLFV